MTTTTTPTAPIQLPITVNNTARHLNNVTNSKPFANNKSTSDNVTALTPLLQGDTST